MRKLMGVINTVQEQRVKKREKQCFTKKKKKERNSAAMCERVAYRTAP